MIMIITQQNHMHQTNVTSHVPEQSGSLVSPTAKPNRYVTREMQTFHQKINITRLMAQPNILLRPYCGMMHPMGDTMLYNGQKLGTGKAYRCLIKCLRTMHLNVAFGPDVSLQCENKFIAFRCTDCRAMEKCMLFGGVNR
jgi:hypothetical protein